LSTNRGLSDSFAETFFPLLDAPHLRDLQISGVEIHEESAPFIVQFLSDSRCHLHSFSCNANHLGPIGVSSIVAAVQNNYFIENVSLYANGVVDKALESVIRHLLYRNQHLKREVAKQALTLLVYARTLLLPSSCSTWHTIPPEIQQYILSFLAPTLSFSQLIKICDYASSSSTLHHTVGLQLPNLLTAKHTQCIPDPGSLSFQSSGGSCSPGTCRGLSQSISCHREEERLQWLECVDCLAYRSD
jgi:hypothetical protein